MRHRKKVFCQNCACLLLVKGSPPLCVATAYSVPGPIRDVVDVRGVEFALNRNESNSCRLYKRVWFKATGLKQIAMQMMKVNHESSLDEVLRLESERDFTYHSPTVGLSSSPVKQRENLEEEQDSAVSEWLNSEEPEQELQQEEEDGADEEESEDDPGFENIGEESIDEEQQQNEETASEEEGSSIWDKYREDPNLINELL